MFRDRTLARQPDAQERELVERLRAGDEDAFEAFSEHYIAGLYRFALRRLDNDRELTREIVQSTVCKVIEKLDGYRGEAPLFTWLCACCRNEITARRTVPRLWDIRIQPWRGDLWADSSVLALLLVRVCTTVVYRYSTRCPVCAITVA